MLRQATTASSKAFQSVFRACARRPLPKPQFHIAPIVPARQIQPSIARLYSAEVKSTANDSSAATPENGEAKPATSGEPAVSETEAALQKELEAKSKEALDWKDKCLRSVADFRNLQDRTAREMKSARDFAIQKFAKDLVDSIDNLDRALTMVPEEKLKATDKSEAQQDLANLYDGIKMTETILMQTVKKHGLERFDPDGEKFNPNEHDATFMAPMKDKENNTVFHVQQKGFKLNGRVLRAAKVGVVKNT